MVLINLKSEYIVQLDSNEIYTINQCISLFNIKKSWFKYKVNSIENIINDDKSVNFFINDLEKNQNLNYVNINNNNYKVEIIQSQKNIIDFNENIELDIYEYSSNNNLSDNKIKNDFKQIKKENYEIEKFFSNASTIDSLNSDSCIKCNKNIDNLVYFKCNICKYIIICINCFNIYKDCEHNLIQNNTNFNEKLFQEIKIITTKLSDVYKLNVILSFNDLVKLRTLIQIFGLKHMLIVSRIFINNKNLPIFNIENKIKFVLNF